MNIQIYIVDKVLVLIPALYIIGMIIKKLDTIPDKFIPLILLGVGIASSIGLLGFSMNAIIQGILVTGVTVFSNQLYRQSKNDK